MIGPGTLLVRSVNLKRARGSASQMFGWGWQRLRLAKGEVGWGWGWLRVSLVKGEIGWGRGWLWLAVEAGLVWRLLHPLLSAATNNKYCHPRLLCCCADRGCQVEILAATPRDNRLSPGLVWLNPGLAGSIAFSQTKHSVAGHGFSNENIFLVL